MTVRCEDAKSCRAEELMRWKGGGVCVCVRLRESESYI